MFKQMSRQGEGAESLGKNNLQFKRIYEESGGSNLTTTKDVPPGDIMCSWLKKSRKKALKLTVDTCRDISYTIKQNSNLSPTAMMGKDTYGPLVNRESGMAENRPPYDMW